MLFLPTRSCQLCRGIGRPSAPRAMASAAAPRALRRSPSVEALANHPAQRPAAHGHAGIALTCRFRQQGLSFSLPSEMWGAASLALQLSKSCTGTGLTRVASAWSQPLSTLAAPQPSGDNPKSIAEALRFKPSLTALQDTLCLVFSAGVCSLAYSLTAPATFQLRYAATMALLYAAMVVVGRSWLLERQFKALQRSERELAALDSNFLSVDGIDVHYKSRRPRHPPPRPPPATPAASHAGSARGQPSPGFASHAEQAEQPPQRAVHCMHGFGASAYSWSFVQDELARELGAVVTAHDMPGFGLTQRPASPRYYTLGFNGAAARAVMDAELAAAPQSKQSVQRVLIGHSMGGAAVAEGVINNPEGISAIVLVAPAIVALWAGPPQQAQRGSVAGGLAVVEEMVSAQDPPDELEVESSGESVGESSADAEDPPAAAEPVPQQPQGVDERQSPHHHHRHRVRHRGPRTVRMVVAVVQACALQVVRMVLRMAAPLIVLLLRRLVRDRRFWERGLTSAWVDTSRITSQYVDAYSCGQLVRGWEHGILNFLAGRFAEKLSFWDTLHHVVRGDGHLSQAERLAQVVEQHGIRVLIVHGTQDVLVPAANSRRLARLLPGARLVELQACGHMPQEEAAERFVREVVAFLREG